MRTDAYVNADRNTPLTHTHTHGTTYLCIHTQLQCIPPATVARPQVGLQACARIYGHASSSMIDTQAAREATYKYPHDEGHVCKCVRPSDRPHRRTRAHASARPRRDTHAPVGASTCTRRFIHSQSVHIHEEMYRSIFTYIYTNVGLSIKPDTLPLPRTHGYAHDRIYAPMHTHTFEGYTHIFEGAFRTQVQTRARVCSYTRTSHTLTRTQTHTHTRARRTHAAHGSDGGAYLDGYLRATSTHPSPDREAGGSCGKRRRMHAQSYACDVACLPTRTRVYVEMRMYGCRTSNTDRARPPRCAPPAGSGAYIAQRGDGGGVPRADVCVERRVVERLRAEPHAVDADGKGSHVSARIRVLPNTKIYM
jgi:hypothetical protein